MRSRGRFTRIHRSVTSSFPSPCRVVARPLRLHAAGTISTRYLHSSSTRSRPAGLTQELSAAHLLLGTALAGAMLVPSPRHLNSSSSTTTSSASRPRGPRLTGSAALRACCELRQHALRRFLALSAASAPHPLLAPTSRRGIALPPRVIASCGRRRCRSGSVRSSRQPIVSSSGRSELVHAAIPARRSLPAAVAD